jgi:hypothetical protein
MLESRVKDVQQRFDALRTKVNEERRQVDTLKVPPNPSHSEKYEFLCFLRCWQPISDHFPIFSYCRNLFRRFMSSSVKLSSWKCNIMNELPRRQTLIQVISFFIIRRFYTYYDTFIISTKVSRKGNNCCLLRRRILLERICLIFFRYVKYVNSDV